MPGTEILFLTVRCQPARAIEDGYFHISISNCPDAGITEQRQLRAVDVEADAFTTRGIDHQPVKRNFLAGDLSEFAGEIE